MIGIDLINTIMLAIAVFGGLFFLLIWRRERRYEASMTREEVMIQRKTLEEQSRKNEEREKTDKNGYIIIEVPPEHRSLFHDFLKGFEDYAKIRGYNVSFSADSSNDSTISFKFTILDSGISVSTDKVREDFNDYLKKIQSNDPLDSLPVVTTKEEHDLLLTQLKNRINFLQHSYNLTKNTVEYYEKLLSSAPLKLGFHSAPPVIVQTGGQLDTRTYTSSNSSNLIQGDGSQMTSITTDNSVYIASSFNERKNQIDDLTSLIGLLKNDLEDQPAQKAVLELEKVKSELEDEGNPDSSRIEKWLKKASEYLSTANKTKELFDKAKGVYDSFKVGEWIDAIGSLFT